MSTAFSQFSLGGIPVRTDMRGNWNASTNTPALSSGTGETGEMYRVSVAGSTTLDGIATWAVDDYVYFNGTAWQKDDHNNAGGGATPDLATVLGVGNTTGGSDLILSAGDKLDIDGNVREKFTATGVATGTDLVSRVIANPNAGVNSQMVFFTAQIVAHAEPPGAPPAAVDTAAWKVEGVIVREVVTDTVLLPTPPVITPLYNPNAPGWDVAVTADDPSKSLKIAVTVDGFGGFAGPPPASFFCELFLVPTGSPV